MTDMEIPSRGSLTEPWFVSNFISKHKILKSLLNIFWEKCDHFARMTWTFLWKKRMMSEIHENIIFELEKRRIFRNFSKDNFQNSSIKWSIFVNFRTKHFVSKFSILTDKVCNQPMFKNDKNFDDITPSYFWVSALGVMVVHDKINEQIEIFDLSDRAWVWY